MQARKETPTHIAIPSASLDISHTSRRAPFLDSSTAPTVPAFLSFHSIIAYLWHEITISHSGTKIVASLDGKQMIELEDSTFTEAGKVGLWVKADGKTAFDNLWVARLGPRAKDQSE